MKMSGVPRLVCVCVLLVAQSGSVHSEILFLEKQEGESVVFPCKIQQSGTPPVGIYLKRTWLRRANVLFMYTNSEFTVNDPNDQERTSVSGDPSSKAVSITISELTAADTGRYQCDFVVSNPVSEDEHVTGETEFFLLVHAAPASGDIEMVEACAGASVVIPCAPPLVGARMAVEGVSLKRRRGRAPVELLYHSKRQHGSEPPSPGFPAERVQLSSVPGPGGIAYNLSLRQLRPEDSGLYSCQLLQRGGPDSSRTLGSPAVFVSVQGRECGCSSNLVLIYGLSSIVGVLVLLLGCVGVYKCKARRGVAELRPQAPIYEEMTGMQHISRKLGPPRLNEVEYTDSPVKKSCPENHYESPRGALPPVKGC